MSGVELVRCTALDAPVKKFEAKLETVLEDAAQTVESGWKILCRICRF